MAPCHLDPLLHIVKMSPQYHMEKPHSPLHLFSGIFTVSVAGVYTVALTVFGTRPTSEAARLNMILNKADGSGQKIVCGAHVQEVIHEEASCSTLLELDVGDQLWAVGHSNGWNTGSPIPFSAFQAYLLYRDDALQ